MLTLSTCLGTKTAAWPNRSARWRHRHGADVWKCSCQNLWNMGSSRNGLNIYCLVVWNIFFPYIGNTHLNWRTHIFQRGRYTTNQYMLLLMVDLLWEYPLKNHGSMGFVPIFADHFFGDGAKLDTPKQGLHWMINWWFARPSILTHTDVFIHYLLIAQGVTSSKYCYIALFLSKIVFKYFFVVEFWRGSGSLLGPNAPISIHFIYIWALA